MIERARMITRRNNPQPFFNLFRPVVRAPTDNPTTPRGDDVGAFETQAPSQSDSTNTAQPSDVVEGILEVARFPVVCRGMNADSPVSIHNPGYP